MKYLSYIMAIVSFALGQVTLVSPWVTGMVQISPTPNAELSGLGEAVSPPLANPEVAAEAYFWQPTLYVPSCRTMSETEWISDDIRQTFHTLRRLGIGLFVLQLASWCTFPGLVLWMNRKTNHAALLGIIGICLACGVFTLAELTNIGPMIGCFSSAAPDIFIKSVELVQPTLVISLGSLATGFAAIVMSYWGYRRAKT